MPWPSGAEDMTMIIQPQQVTTMPGRCTIGSRAPQAAPGSFPWPGFIVHTHRSIASEHFKVHLLRRSVSILERDGLCVPKYEKGFLDYSTSFSYSMCHKHHYRHKSHLKNRFASFLSTEDTIPHSRNVAFTTTMIPGGFVSRLHQGLVGSRNLHAVRHTVMKISCSIRSHFSLDVSSVCCLVDSRFPEQTSVFLIFKVASYGQELGAGVGFLLLQDSTPQRVLSSGVSLRKIDYPTLLSHQLNSHDSRCPSAPSVSAKPNKPVQRSRVYSHSAMLKLIMNVTIVHRDDAKKRFVQSAQDTLNLRLPRADFKKFFSSKVLCFFRFISYSRMKRLVQKMKMKKAERTISSQVFFNFFYSMKATLSGMRITPHQAFVRRMLQRTIARYVDKQRKATTSKTAKRSSLNARVIKGKSEEICPLCFLSIDGYSVYLQMSANVRQKSINGNQLPQVVSLARFTYAFCVYRMYWLMMIYIADKSEIVLTHIPDQAESHLVYSQRVYTKDGLSYTRLIYDDECNLPLELSQMDVFKSYLFTYGGTVVTDFASTHVEKHMFKKKFLIFPAFDPQTHVFNQKTIACVWRAALNEQIRAAEFLSVRLMDKVYLFQNESYFSQDDMKIDGEIIYFHRGSKFAVLSLPAQDALSIKEYLALLETIFLDFSGNWDDVGIAFDNLGAYFCYSEPSESVGEIDVDHTDPPTSVYSTTTTSAEHMTTVISTTTAGRVQTLSYVNSESPVLYTTQRIDTGEEVTEATEPSEVTTRKDEQLRSSDTHKIAPPLVPTFTVFRNSTHDHYFFKIPSYGQGEIDNHSKTPGFVTRCRKFLISAKLRISKRLPPHARVRRHTNHCELELADASHAVELASLRLLEGDTFFTVVGDQITFKIPFKVDNSTRYDLASIDLLSMVFHNIAQSFLRMYSANNRIAEGTVNAQTALELVDSPIRAIFGSARGQASVSVGSVNVNDGFDIPMSSLDSVYNTFDYITFPRWHDVRFCKFNILAERINKYEVEARMKLLFGDDTHYAPSDLRCVLRHTSHSVLNRYLSFYKGDSFPEDTIDYIVYAKNYLNPILCANVFFTHLDLNTSKFLFCIVINPFDNGFPDNINAESRIAHDPATWTRNSPVVITHDPYWVSRCSFSVCQKMSFATYQKALNTKLRPRYKRYDRYLTLVEKCSVRLPETEFTSSLTTNRAAVPIDLKPYLNLL